MGLRAGTGQDRPGLEVVLEVAALQHLRAVLRERAGHQQLVEKFVDQDAGLLAVLQDHTLAIHGTEVLLHQEVGEAHGAVGVSTGSVQRVQQGLQADVADEVIVHVVGVGVEVVFLGGVGLATHHAQGVRAGIRVVGRVWLVHGRLGNSGTADPAKRDFLRTSQDLLGAICKPGREQDGSSLLHDPQNTDAERETLLPVDGN